MIARPVRALILPLLLVAGLVAAPLLTPTAGGTQARWSAAQSVPVGTLSNDSLGVSMTAAQHAANDTTTLSLANQSSRLPATVSLSSTVLIDGSPVDGVAAAVGPHSPVQLGPGQAQDLSLEVSGTDERSVLLAHAGQTATATTTAVPGFPQAHSWTAEPTQVTTEHPIPFPAPSTPGRGGLRAVCDSGLGNFGATLSWAWPDSGVSSATRSAAIDRWTVEVLDGGAWKVVHTTAPESRSADISHDDVDWSLYQSARFRVVAHPHAGQGVPATFEVELYRSLGWRVTCLAIR